MDREKVKAELDEIVEHCRGMDYIGFSTITEHCQNILALLKEQEARQIVRKQGKKEYDDRSIDYFAQWYCPHCNSLILRGYDNPSIKFCYKCGKPILWEGR